ncbi:MAG TPA: helix-turn-helix transcriptional regulator [Smithellaceae bacterium]|nr:helix-turn-helix transcriptional regulator [Smithellaceae bacterium]
MELEKEIFKDGMPKGYYTQNDNGKYVLDTNHCWSEEVCVAAIVSEVRANIENARKEVLAGLKSPLCYHMAVRQMDVKFLARAAGIAVFRVKRHMRPEIFVKLKPSVLDRYAVALAVTPEELKTVADSEA